MRVMTFSSEKKNSNGTFATTHVRTATVGTTGDVGGILEG